MPRFIVKMERPKWTEKKHIQDAKANVPMRSRGYDWSKTDKKTMAVDANHPVEALEVARDLEEVRLDGLIAVKINRHEFEDMVAVEFWRRENRYFPIEAEVDGTSG
jgi:hypothetical protein